MPASNPKESIEYLLGQGTCFASTVIYGKPAPRTAIFPVVALRQGNRVDAFCSYKRERRSNNAPFVRRDCSAIATIRAERIGGDKEQNAPLSARSR